MKNLKFLVILSGLLIGVGAQAMCPFRLVNWTPNTIHANIGKDITLTPEGYSTIGYKEIFGNGNSKCFYKGRIQSSVVHIRYPDDGQSAKFFTGVDDLKRKLKNIDWDNVVVIRPGTRVPGTNRIVNRITKLVFFGLVNRPGAPLSAAYSLRDGKSVADLEAVGVYTNAEANTPTIAEFCKENGIPLPVKVK